MTRDSLVGRLSLFTLGALVASSILSATARAECGDDLKKMSERRAAILADINNMAAISKKEKKPMDAAVVCAKAHNLGAAEDALLAYMAKNKDWCSIPDEVVANLKESHAKSTEFGGRACVAAAKMKKMQEQQAAGGAPAGPPPLPAGPL
jgi:hypothetical protein